MNVEHLLLSQNMNYGIYMQILNIFILESLLQFQIQLMILQPPKKLFCSRT
jgi:hypothetical protein